MACESDSRSAPEPGLVKLNNLWRRAGIQRHRKQLGCEKTSFGRGGYGRSSSGGSGGFRSFKPKPVEVGKEYDVTISEISRRGDGIAKIDGFVIFVSGAKQGWQGKIKVTQVANRFATGAVVGGSEGMSGADGQASTSESEEQGA
ncbi:MAG: TRAM domain-containing protein [Nitrososphaerota archaeon]|nr:TRAM domain-containing protein [Nitrososphaerota archaeon]MDG7026229.1 TRAM domain-containing protein [Nitrososphaerota archaeon]